MYFKRNNPFSRVIASSVAVLVSATSLYAIPRGPCDTPPEPVCCDEPKPGPFAFSYPWDLELACPRDFYFHVDGLAFQAKQDGMQFALYNANGPAQVSTAPIQNGQFQGFSGENKDWKYDWGVRVGIGFFLDHDAWQLDFDWTYLKINNYRRANATTSGSIMIPLWDVGNTSPTTDMSIGTSAVWDGNYDTLDLSLGKPYHVSRYLVLNPFFGVRAGWIDQHFSVDYGGQNIAGVNNRFIHHADNNFWGFGARAGLNSDWMIGKGFCLFGNFATSLLYGKFNIEQHLKTSGTNQGFDMYDDHYMNVPNMEIALGFGWGKFFDKNRYHVNLRAAYEFHLWWDQLNLRKFFAGAPQYPNDVVARGNLSLSGFSLRLGFDM